LYHFLHGDCFVWQLDEIIRILTVNALNQPYKLYFPHTIRDRHGPESPFTWKFISRRNQIFL